MTTTTPRLRAPAPRPAQGFSSARAQRWVLAAAVFTGLIYAFRRAVEPAGATSTTGSGLKQLAGQGQPPSLEHWAVAYGTAFVMLSMLALAVPEAAATLAAMIVVGSLLTNGMQIANDLGQLQGTTSTSKPLTGTPGQQGVQLARHAGITGPIAPLTTTAPPGLRGGS